MCGRLGIMGLFCTRKLMPSGMGGQSFPRWCNGLRGRRFGGERLKTRSGGGRGFGVLGLWETVLLLAFGWEALVG